ncbi:MAG: hypothetical protein PHC98_01655 [Syntrophotalea acetylenica]|jgi:hypothetical protein|nr:hypothetical protein [Syntrophotalea acetylenica]
MSFLLFRFISNIGRVHLDEFGPRQFGQDICSLPSDRCGKAHLERLKTRRLQLFIQIRQDFTLANQYKKSRSGRMGAARQFKSGIPKVDPLHQNSPGCI